MQKKALQHIRKHQRGKMGMQQIPTDRITSTNVTVNLQKSLKYVCSTGGKHLHLPTEILQQMPIIVAAPHLCVRRKTQEFVACLEHPCSIKNL
jgi:hypothetical protein